MQSILRIPLAVFTTYCVFAIVKSKDCHFEINEDLSEPQPLFLKPNSTNFWSVEKDGILKIGPKDKIEFYCTKGFEKYKDDNSLFATCIEGKKFSVNDDKVSVDKLKCTSEVKYKAREKDKKCAKNAKRYEIGFELSKKRFIKTIDICHDNDTVRTLWVRTELDASNKNYQKSVKRPNFSEGNMFGKLKVNRLYSKANQEKVFEELLGKKNFKKFFGKKHFLARGHLSPKTDHIFGAQQMATFNFLNVAPQWQKFNAGTWSSVESGARKFIAKENLTVDCYTGTWGVASLPNKKDSLEKLYLTYDENDNGIIPVPQLFYKVIVDEKTKKGVAIIGINNLFIDSDDLKSDKFVICKDITKDLSWFKWQTNDTEKGYLYTCKVAEFIKVVKDLPESLKKIKELLD